MATKRRRIQKRVQKKGKPENPKAQPIGMPFGGNGSPKDDKPYAR